MRRPLTASGTWDTSGSGCRERLLAMFDETKTQVPEFPAPKSDYLFKPPAKGRPRQLMRLIGGELRYDRIPKSQRHLIEKPTDDSQ